MELELYIGPTTGCFPVESCRFLFGAGELSRRLPSRVIGDLVTVRGEYEDIGED